MESKLVKNQKLTTEWRDTGETDYTGKPVMIRATIRYDDECGNGHNSFSITGDTSDGGGGCIHDEIEKHFPEYTPLIKWHLTSSDGPMHYVANTMYHARTCDTKGAKPGDITGYNTTLKFADFPFTFDEQKKGFWEYLDSVGDFNNISVESIPYDGKDTYDFSDNYSFTGFIKENQVKQWYATPFNTLQGASEFLEALQQHKYSYVKTPCKWAKAEEPNLEYARSSAVWPDATLEQLQDEKVLTDRLPGLLVEFKQAVESVGFTY